MFDWEPILCDLEAPAVQKKCQTMVFISFPNFMSTNSLTISRAKITSETVYQPWENIFEPPPQPRKCHQLTLHAAVAVTLKLGFIVWIVMGHIGGVSLASFCTMLNIPSITPSSGIKDPLKMFHWVLLLPQCDFRAWAAFCHQLFPSTFDWPETAFTLDVLDYYGIDAMECKTSAQSFFQTLRRVTDNAFSDEVPVCLSVSDH